MVARMKLLNVMGLLYIGMMAAPASLLWYSDAGVKPLAYPPITYSVTKSILEIFVI
jgi:hypothetical protein